MQLSLLIICFVISATTASEFLNRTTTSIGSSRSVEEGRKRHHFLSHFGHFGHKDDFEFEKFGHLFGFGGLHALALIYVIKVGFLIVAGVAWTLFYFWTKFYTKEKSCLGVPIIREVPQPPPPVIRYEGFAAPEFAAPPPGVLFDHPPPDYNGPDPYSAYSHIHSDISAPELHPPISGEYPGNDIHPGPSSYGGGSSDYSDHPGGYPGGYSDTHPGGASSGFGDVHPGPSGYGDAHQPGPPAAVYGVPDHPIDVPQSSDRSGISSSAPYRRVSIQQQQQRQFSGTGFENVNWGELAFRFLGVDSMGCRKRFICEFDFKAKQNPFTRMAYSFIDRNFFDQYRDQTAEKPKRYRDCARIFKECHAVGATVYEGDSNEEVTESDNNVEVTTTAIDDDEESNDLIEHENSIENENSNKTKRSRTISSELTTSSLLTRFSAKIKN